MFLSTRSAPALLVFALVASAHAQADNVTFFRTTIHNQTSADEWRRFPSPRASAFLESAPSPSFGAAGTER